MKIQGKIIILENDRIEFDFDIRTVIETSHFFIILLSIPFDTESVNNIYGINKTNREMWQIENHQFWTKLLPYENISKGESGDIFATDFYGRRVVIDETTGLIKSHSIVK